MVGKRILGMQYQNWEEQVSIDNCWFRAWTDTFNEWQTSTDQVTKTGTVRRWPYSTVIVIMKPVHVLSASKISSYNPDLYRPNVLVLCGPLSNFQPWKPGNLFNGGWTVPLVSGRCSAVCMGFPRGDGFSPGWFAYSFPLASLYGIALFIFLFLSFVLLFLFFSAFASCAGFVPGPNEKTNILYLDVLKRITLFLLTTWISAFSKHPSQSLLNQL